MRLLLFTVVKSNKPRRIATTELNASKVFFRIFSRAVRPELMWSKDYIKWSKECFCCSVLWPSLFPLLNNTDFEYFFLLMRFTGLWIVSHRIALFGDVEVEIIASKYANRSEFVFDPRYEHNKDNAILCLPTETKSNAGPFPIWLKRKIKSAESSEASDCRESEMFGISLIDSYEVDVYKTGRQHCRFAFVLMGTQLQISALQASATRGLKIVREGLRPDACLTGELL